MRMIEIEIDLVFLVPWQVVTGLGIVVPIVRLRQLDRPVPSAFDTVRDSTTRIAAVRARESSSKPDVLH